MSDRDELAGFIRFDKDGEFWRDFALDIADVILAAGYRKPRTVTTVEELDALPDDSAVRDAQGFIYVKCHGFGDPGFPWWESTGEQRGFTAGHAYLPATVLYTPEPQS
jgi:hypothetical protein